MSMIWTEGHKLNWLCGVFVRWLVGWSIDRDCGFIFAKHFVDKDEIGSIAAYN